MKKRKLILLLSLVMLSLPAHFQTKNHRNLLEASPGDLVELPDILNNDFPHLDYKKVILPGPQFVISDDPEYIKEPEAIALKELVDPGSVRLYIYNVNGVEEPKMERKITALLTNKGGEELTLRMLRKSSQPPSKNYYQVGKDGLADFFASEESKKSITIRPGKTIPIAPLFEKSFVQYNELVHGIYEFVIDQPAEINILQTAVDTESSKALSQINSVLPPSSHSGAGRGKFGVSNYQINIKDTVKTSNGPVQLIVADGEKDPWIEGKEGSTGNSATLAGNYGVMYDINIPWKSDNTKAMALVTWNSRSGNNKWCKGMANSILLNPETEKEQIIKIPSNNLITRQAPEAVLIKVFKNDSKKEIQNISLRYSPPGASCLPTPLILIPIKEE